VAETHYMLLTVINVLVVATFLADLVVAFLADYKHVSLFWALVTMLAVGGSTEVGLPGF
jgi:hypothetical protein